MATLSKKRSINWFDALKALIITIGTSIMGSLIPIVTLGKFPDHEQIALILGTAVGAGLTYLLKQFETDEKGQLFKK